MFLSRQYSEGLLAFYSFLFSLASNSGSGSYFFDIFWFIIFFIRFKYYGITDTRDLYLGMPVRVICFSVK